MIWRCWRDRALEPRRGLLAALVFRAPAAAAAAAATLGELLTTSKLRRSNTGALPAAAPPPLLPAPTGARTGTDQAPAAGSIALIARRGCWFRASCGPILRASNAPG